MATPDTADRKKKLLKELAIQEKKLKSLQDSQLRQNTCRERKRNILDDIRLNEPELAKKLKLKEVPGRPPLDDKHSDLLGKILSIVNIDGAADPRRRSEIIRSCTTLGDLHQQLNKMGIKISKSATYLRLLPKRSNTTEGKRHVRTVPVRLMRAQNSEHKAHIDTEFCLANIRALKTLASFLGPDPTIYISQDDKARVPIGITAANKQTSILMHVEYRVTLPDHDWVKAERHKLIPSVYAGLVIQEKGFGNPSAVTYSGPTIIRIRSGKHDSSTAASHAADLEYAFQSDIF